MTKILMCASLAALLTHIAPADSKAWNDNKSHKFITESAVFSSPDINGLVRDKFGLEEGLNYLIDGETLLEYIQKGSHLEDAKDEDKTIGERATNHFHNPTKIFNEAGLYNYPFSGKSAAVWAYFDDRNKWDLESFYDYFELSFMASTLEERLENLEKTFRTAGHLMHLLQDMAVPAHTRNELYSGHTSKFVPTNVLQWKFPSGSRMESYLKANPRFIAQVPPESIPNFDNFTNYFDTKDYRSNTAQPVSGLSHGLAEYSNSNFLSEMQFFRDDAQVFPVPFPNPNLQNTYSWGLQLDTYYKYPHLRLVLPRVFFSKYLGRASAIHDENVEHLGRVSFFTKYAMLTGTKFIFLDETCYDDYLEKLVPKAVAYSAGLLEFLFRGDIDFEIDVSDTVPIAVTNNSAKDMTGLFTLYYENSKEGRDRVADGEWQLTVPAGETVQVNGPPLDMPRDLGAEQIFTLVFRGTLGSVDRAVTAKTTSFTDFDFAYQQYVEYAEIQQPEPYEYYLLPGSLNNTPADYWLRHFDCTIEFKNILSDHTVWRTTNFTFKVKSTPAIAKKIGRLYVEDQWFTLNSSSMPEVVKYIKISKAPGKWEYLVDGSGTNSVEPGTAFGFPVGYIEGLWRTDTGYQDIYRNQIGAHNSADECTLREGISPADIIVNLYYPILDVSPPEPNCPNDDEIMDRARSLCNNEYTEFYHETLSMAAPYLPTIQDDEWRNYGVEIGMNRLTLLHPLKGDGTIYNAPVTITKPYGSTELIVH